MKKFVAFVAIGSLFATVEEFLTVVVLRHDIPSYVFTLLVLFPVYLAFVYSSGWILDRLVGRGPARDLVHLLTYGSIGLMLEWFLMGLSPWSNPAANPLLMLAFQVGMFAFWATVATAPRVLLDPRGPARDAARRVLRFSIPYFAMVYVAGLWVPGRLRFATIIPLIIFGYSVIAGLLIQYVIALYAQASRREAGGPGPATPRGTPRSSA